MKKTTKFLCLVLVLTSILSLFSFPMAADTNKSIITSAGTVTILEQTNEQGISTEIIKINGLEKHYYDNLSYTLTAEELSDGSIMVYYKNKSTGILSEYEFVSGETIESAKQEVIDESVLPKRQNTINTYVAIIEDENAKSGTPAQIVGTKLESVYGQQYYENFIDATFYEGYYAGLYETMAFSITKKIDYWAYAGVAATLVAAAISWPLSSILIALTCVSLVGGVIAIANDYKASIYTSKICYYKDCKVLSNYTCCVGKTITQEALVGDKDCALKYISTTQDSIFSNNLAIMQKGIDNYIRFW